MLAALGECETESGKAKLSDEERRQVRRQASGVLVKSGATGVVCTLLVWWLSHLSS
ncbi:MAG TPA: hypothetical protein VFD67_05870 [Gemmatimonadaceae bacterium]|nr:hypothetical protein [Gemmatimonadaceae bacterium]